MSSGCVTVVIILRAVSERDSWIKRPSSGCVTWLRNTLFPGAPCFHVWRRACGADGQAVPTLRLFPRCGSLSYLPRPVLFRTPARPRQRDSPAGSPLPACTGAGKTEFFWSCHIIWTAKGFKMAGIYIVPLSKALYNLCFLFTSSHTHLHTNGNCCHARYQPARQERSVRCLAQGHFDTPRVGSNQQPLPTARRLLLPPEQCRHTARASYTHIHIHTKIHTHTHTGQLITVIEMYDHIQHWEHCKVNLV